MRTRLTLGFPSCTCAIPMSAASKQQKRNALIEVHMRLFALDVAQIKAIAAERGMKWQVELRMLVRRTLAGERREVVLLKESK